MRLMVVGSDQVYSIENYYVRYLREAGVDVSLFIAQNYFYEYYNRSLVNKLIYKSSLSRIIPKINDLFKSEVIKFNPDIIWIFKGMEILPSTLSWLKVRNIKLVNYNPDNPFIFSGSGSGNSNITRSIGLYNLHFTYNLEVKARLEKDYQVETSFLPFGFDLNDDLFNACVDQQEIRKLCFVGNPDAGRVELIKKMVSSGIQIDVYGHNWSRYVNDSSIHLYPAVYGSDFWKVLRRYRIQLNLMRPHNLNSHNMRTFEVPGVGGIMLAPDTREHKMFFRDGSEVFLFTAAEHAIELSRQILNLSFEDANKVRKNARKISIENGYTYRDRAQSALLAMDNFVTK